MKRILLVGYLILITACQAATQTPLTESAPIIQTQTPTQPATATLAFTATPEFTPTPIPFFFTEEFTTDSGAWVSFQTGGTANPTLTINDDLLRLDIPSPNTWFYAIHNVHTYEDVFINARFTGIPAGSMGLICRYSDGGWFEFNIANDGTYSVLFAQLLEEGIAQYTPIATNSSEYLQPGTLDYEIGLTCQENHLLLHINGKLFRKLDVTRYGLTAGRVGISVSSFEETPMIASFDWVRVAAPDQ